MAVRAGQIGQRPGRALPATAVPATAALAAVSLLAALVLSACGPNAAAAKTVLRSARAATLDLADGGSRPATEGMTVPKGATVRTAPGGSAALVAAGRSVLLGSATAVTVVDGAHEQLRAGLVLVDARRGAGLRLDAGPATVSSERGSLSRVERGALLRAASYRSSLTVRATGRVAEQTVTALHQVQVPDGGLPGRPTPLTLTPHDTWERSYALDLVTADADIVALGEGLDRNPSSDSAVLRALPASYAAAVPTGSTEPPSETALAYVVAKASGSDSVGRFTDVRSMREDGGSWGVVAALVRARTSAIAAALDAVLNPNSAPGVLAAQPGATLSPSVVLGRGPGATGRPSNNGPSSGPGSGPSHRPSPRPSPSGSPDPVKDVVATVSGLLPSPSPTAVPHVAAPSASPLIGVHVGGVGVTVGG